jgi:tetratricopeptide (TPR) repeat protein
MEKINKNNITSVNLINEIRSWNKLQWLIISFLLIAFFLAVYSKIPQKQAELPLGFKPLSIDQEIAAYQKQLTLSKDNFIFLDKLADAYLSKGRITGDPGWYLLAEQKAAASLAVSEKGNSAAFLVLARINMFRHNFPEAVTLAQKVLEDPNSRIDGLGIIFDADFARGDYAGAKKALDEMQTTRMVLFKLKRIKLDPGANIGTVDKPESISLAREAMLDIATGKEKEAAKLFLSALKELGSSDEESKAWVYSLYANYLANYGQIAEAKNYLKFSLNTVPGYPAARLQLAEIARTEGNWHEVKNILENGTDKNPNAQVLIRLAEAESKLGNRESFSRLLGEAEEQLKRESEQGNFGHQRDYIRLLLLKHTPEALKEARKRSISEISQRQDIETLYIAIEEAFLNKDQAREQKYLETAFKPGVHDARLSYFQGRYFRSNGSIKEAIKYYRQALAINPFFDQDAVREINSLIDKKNS